MDASLPRRTHALRWRGKRLIVYRATAEAVRSTLRKETLDVPAMDRAARDALRLLFVIVSLSRIKVV